MSTTITFDYPLLVQGKTQAIFDGVYEAELNPDCRNDRTNAELTIYMRIHLYDGFYDSSITTKAADGKSGTAKDSDNNTFTVYPWPASAFRIWRKDLVTTARTFWNGKFWLVTPSSFNRLDWPPNRPTHRPNIWCRFELEEATKTDAHFAIACCYLGKSPTRNSNFRSHMFLYDSDDPLSTKKHEVGHLLGLDHPGGRNNNAAAYNDRPGYPNDIMGRGKRIHPHHARPWQKAIASMTDTPWYLWKAALSRVYPKPLKK